MRYGLVYASQDDRRYLLRAVRVAALKTALQTATGPGWEPFQSCPVPVIDESALTAAHLAIEDTLVDLRDSRIGVLGRANGFVVNERDGSPSAIMRIGTRDGLRIAIRAYLEAVNGA